MSVCVCGNEYHIFDMGFDSNHIQGNGGVRLSSLPKLKFNNVACRVWMCVILWRGQSLYAHYSVSNVYVSVETHTSILIQAFSQSHCVH